MAYFGVATSKWEASSFEAFSALSAALLLVHTYAAIIKYRKFPFLLLPLVSFAMLYVNIILSLGETVDSGGAAASVGEVIRASVVPCFSVICFEMAYLLHRKRSAKFCGVAFDEGADQTLWRRRLLLAGVRSAAIGLFVLGVLIAFEAPRSTAVNRQGYIAFGHDVQGYFFLARAVPTAFILVGVTLSVQMWRYGRTFALDQLSSPTMWRYILLGVLMYTLGEIFDKDVYRVTSNAGSLGLLICLSLLCIPVLADLQEAREFEHFLHQSDIEFDRRSSTHTHTNTSRRSTKPLNTQTLDPQIRFNEIYVQVHQGDDTERVSFS